MILSSPFFISSRLLPALRIAGAVIQLEYSRRPGGENRIRYQWTIDLPSGKSFTASDLSGPACGISLGLPRRGDLREGFVALLLFLSACAESYARRGIDGENSDLFPVQVAEWAATYSDEITLASCELEETPDAIRE